MLPAAKSIVKTEKAPGAIGPYSQAVRAGSIVFVSGQLALLPETGKLVDHDIQAETRQAVTNLKNILIAAGSSLDHVVKTTLFIRKMDDFSKINEVYGEFFLSDPPARSCVEVSCLPKNANIEIEAIALLISQTD
ncbi:MAG: RidA family protein [Desulfobacterales bacterium]|nr:RidA family protein [Desulfobacterales bacterium]